MSAFQERIKVFRELPILKVQLEELKLKLESLEKIKNNVSSENYLSLSNRYVKQISELTHRIDELQAGIVVQKNEIELDSKVLESENSLVEKELQEMQFLFERGALSKQDYKVKRNTLQQKINKNKSHLGKNQSCNKELDFYATYIGIDKYIRYSYNTLLDSLRNRLSFFKTKVFYLIASILIILLIIIKIFGSSGTVKIGDQKWSIRNLDIDHFRNGDPIPQVQDEKVWANLESGAWCYYKNSSANGKTYGKLYNWYAVNDPRGLAPKGWHIPSDDEWTTLTEYLGGESVAGGKLKEISTTHWANPNTGATNESGFSGLPGGYRADNGTFKDITNICVWWSSTEYSNKNAYYRNLLHNYATIDKSNHEKEAGFSVMCIKDY